MAGDGLTYRDFQQRISMEDVLREAGYVQNRKDGLRYPSYSRIGADGNRVSGDKFIVTRNGLCCFRPPEDKRYNVISFIKAFPENFTEYRPGMDPDRLVNLVCNRMLNRPVDLDWPAKPEVKPFDITNYEVKHLDPEDWESIKPFYPWFKNRGLDVKTQRAFAGSFCLATSPKGYTNLSFPLRRPGEDAVIGFEERGKPNAEGKCAYKGIAAGSDAANGLWIATPGSAQPVAEPKEVLWFESAYDAMAYFQLHRADRDFSRTAFVSTSGNPSRGQQEGMACFAPEARHVLCFDADEAGEKFARNLYTAHPELDVVRSYPDPPHKDWNDQLIARNKQDEDRSAHRGR